MSAAGIACPTPPFPFGATRPVVAERVGARHRQGQRATPPRPRMRRSRSTREARRVTARLGPWTRPSTLRDRGRGCTRSCRSWWRNPVWRVLLAWARTSPSSISSRPLGCPEGTPSACCPSLPLRGQPFADRGSGALEGPSRQRRRADRWRKSDRPATPQQSRASDSRVL